MNRVAYIWQVQELGVIMSVSYQNKPTEEFSPAKQDQLAEPTIENVPDGSQFHAVRHFSCGRFNQMLISKRKKHQMLAISVTDNQSNSK